MAATTERKVTDPGQEQLLLHATVGELDKPRTTRTTRTLCFQNPFRVFSVFRGSLRFGPPGRYLVFPSQFNRDYEDAPEQKGKAVAITFDGPV